jgi:hypothetical protein
MLRFCRSCILVALLVAWAASEMEAAGAILGPIFDPYTSYNLFVLPKGSWLQVEMDAGQYGGRLATIVSAADNQFIVDHVLKDFSSTGGANLSNVPVWIGLFDQLGINTDPVDAGMPEHHADFFQWVGGLNGPYRNWNTATGEPNNSSPGEFFTAINWHVAASGGPIGTWNDAPVNGTTGYGGTSDGPYYGLIMVPSPEPGTLILFITGMSGLGLLHSRYRRRAQIHATA